MPEGILHLPHLSHGRSSASLRGRRGVRRLTPVLPTGCATAHPGLFLDDEQMTGLLAFIKSNRVRYRAILSEEVGYVPHYHEWFQTRPFSYDAGLTSCAIMPDGSVTGDLTLYDPKFYEGNIREKPLREIWRDGFHSFRRPELLEKCRDCPCLVPCSGGNLAIRDGRRDCLRRLFGAVGRLESVGVG